MITPRWGLDSEGHPSGCWPYWFCSDSCYEKALRDYIPAEFTKEIEDSPRYKQFMNEYGELTPHSYGYERRIEEFKEFTKNWNREKEWAIGDACSLLYQRISAESSAEHDKFIKEFKEDNARDTAKIKATIAAAIEKNQEFLLKILERPIPPHYRYEHTHILGGSGAGKTTLIQQLILDDLAQPDPPALVIIDPKGLLVERIQQLNHFDPYKGRLKDRLIIIDPTHSPAPTLNMFHHKLGRDAIHRQVESQAISNFAYIFSSVGSKLTDKQSVPFTFLVRLLFTVPKSTVLTLLELLDDPAQSMHQSKFAPHISQLDSISRGFFEKEYFDRIFANSRKEIKARLYSVLMRPEFVEMFSTPERKLDMFECIQSKKIVLVNTAMNALGRESSALLGRYMVALTLNAAFERTTIKDRNKWTPAYLIIDEFQEFADEQKTPELLRLAREYNLGIVLAHQQMHSAEFSDDLRNSISTNTSIKYAASVEAMDLNYVARDLRCEPDFLRAQKRTDTHAHFACFVRNFTDHPMSIKVPLGNITDDLYMPEASHQELLRRNGEKLTVSLAPLEPPQLPTPECAAPLEPHMSEAPYQRHLNENRERVSVTPEAPKSAPIRKAVAPVADTHPGASGDTEAGKDW